MIQFLDIKKITESFEPELSAALQRVAASGWFLRGKETATFERHFADYIGAEYCVGTANGLDALTLILMALREMNGWQAGDKVIVPAFTFIATAEAVNRAGLKPVFCDVSEKDFLLDVRKSEQLITPKTRCILPVHLYGKPFDVAALREWAFAHNLMIVEDAAQAHGAMIKGMKTGSQGIAAAFSFYPGKNLGALGDAGAVVTSNKELADLVRTLGNYGAKEKYNHEYLGLNSRIDEIQAAVLDLKLRHLEAHNAHRKMIAAIYCKEISNPLVRVPSYDAYFQDSVCHIFPVFTLYRKELQEHLSRNGVQTLCHYPLPLHKQKAYAEACADLEFPVSARLAAEELSLPISPVLEISEARSVAKIMNEFTLNK